MDQLKREVVEIFTQYNTDWREIIKSAEEKGEGIDLGDMLGKLGEHMKALDLKFIEARARVRKNKGRDPK